MKITKYDSIHSTDFLDLLELIVIILGIFAVFTVCLLFIAKSGNTNHFDDGRTSKVIQTIEKSI